MSRRSRIGLACSVWLLASCSSPFFAGRLAGIDWSGPPAAGTIAISQPKMYRRESLINERRDEVLWLNAELEDSKKKTFAPELVRETEEIKQFAAALGLNFNPGSAVDYQRDSATGELKQQIEVLKLQLQLDQLRRDADIVRGGLATQTAAVNTDLGKVNATAPGASSGPIAASAVDKLTEAIDRINKDLATRLGTDAKEAASANTTINPSDLFRDRSAYRDLLKSARNAASLDDLHDQGGSALLRLNFQAMVLPEAGRTRAPGVVQMTVQAPKLDARVSEQIYRAWLDHINGQINRRGTDGWTVNTGLVYSKAADSFDLISYRYPISKIKDSDCAGFSPGFIPFSSPCKTLVFAVPKFKATSVQEGGYTSLDAYVRFGSLDDDANEEDAFREAQTWIAQHASTLVPKCGLPQAAPGVRGVPPDDSQLLMRAILIAQQRAAGGDEFTHIDRLTQQMLNTRGLSSGRTNAGAIAARTQRAHRLLKTFEDAAYANCSAGQRAAFRETGPTLYVPQNFLDELADRPTIRVYEIGPREQMQQISTVSRVANNLSLALALAGSKPTTGLSANAAANYTRQAFGRAATIERVPSLIGYAATEDTFGWVVAPKAVLDPKGSINLEQTLRALDLSVELSVPGWWPSFTVVTNTGWALDAISITRGNVKMENPQEFTVPMTANYADYDALTQKLQRGSIGIGHGQALDDIALDKQFISECHATSLYLRGHNIWRATSVVIEGYRLDDTAITVAPDMSGILLAVPVMHELIVTPSKPKVRFSVFTRHGDAEGEVDYIPAPVPDGCDGPDKPVDTTAPVIASVTPVEFKGGSVQWFTVNGANLSKFDRATINGQPGKIDSVSKDGKTLKVIFTSEQTSSLPISRTIAITFFAGEKKLGERLVENRK